MDAARVAQNHAQDEHIPICLACSKCEGVTDTEITCSDKTLQVDTSLKRQFLHYLRVEGYGPCWHFDLKHGRLPLAGRIARLTAEIHNAQRILGQALNWPIRTGYYSMVMEKYPAKIQRLNAKIETLMRVQPERS